MREINSQTKTVRELFSNTKYSLDYYQREYVWQTEHVTELIGDLTNEFSNSYESEHERKEVSNYAHYFLGSIIICEKEDERFIIDGQQRLTTLTLLLIYLDRWLKEEDQKSPLDLLIFSDSFGRGSFNLDIPERATVMEALYSDKFFSLKDQPESIRNIVLRYADIKRCFKLPENHALLHFVDWLLERVFLVEIKAYDNSGAYTVFETMNDRGLSLTPTAMLRGYLLSNINDPEVRSNASATWQKQVESLQTIGNGEDSDAIKAWLRGRYLKNNVDFERIGSEFHRWIRSHPDIPDSTSNTAFSDLIEHDFKFYSDWYYQLRKASKSRIYEFESIFEPVYYNAQNNFTLQYPILLSMLHPNDTKEDILSKIWVGATFLDILIHRCIWNFEDTSQREMVDSMCSVILKIRSRRCSELSDILYAWLKAEAKRFDNNSLFSLHGRNKRKIHLILARMMDYVEIQSGNDSGYSEYMKTGKNGYEVQHIWANNPEHYLDDFPHGFEFEAYRNRIGGLLLLPKGTTTNHGNLSYVEKLNYYANQHLLAASLHEKTYEVNHGFQQFIENSRLPFQPHSEFKKVDLDRRQELYMGLAKQIWDPERLKDSQSYIQKIINESRNRSNSEPTESTHDRIRELVPMERREYYETQYTNKVSGFYNRVAKLRDLTKETEWARTLTIKFQRDYCGFYFGRKPVFGVNLYGSPRFCIWITREEASQFSDQCEFEAYYPQATYAIYPMSATLDTLHPILEFAYKKHRGY